MRIFLFFLPPAFSLLFRGGGEKQEAPTGIALPAVPLRKYDM